MVRRRIYQWLFTAVIATSGVLLSTYIYQGLKKSDESRMLAELQNETYQQSVRASLLFTRAPQILNSFSALFTASEFVSRLEFDRFASYSIKDEQEIVAVAWVPYVSADQRKEYETRLRNEAGKELGFIDITNSEHRPVKSPNRDFYLPIFYGEPKEQAGMLLGIDLNGRATNQDLRIQSMQRGEVITTPVFS